MTRGTIIIQFASHLQQYSQRLCFFFSSRRRHTRCSRDWSSDVCSSDLHAAPSGTGASRVCPSFARARAETNAGRALVSRTVAAHGDDRSQLHGRRSRRSAARNGLQAVGKPHARNRGETASRHGPERDPKRDSRDRKSTRLNSSHGYISYAVFCLKKKKQNTTRILCPQSLENCTYPGSFRQPELT